MDTPEWLRDLAVEAVKAHPNDIKAATDQLLDEASGWKEFGALCDAMIRDSLLHLIHDVRHGLTVQTKRREPYVGPPKVEPGKCAGVHALCDKLKSYYIGGRVLASLRGKELLPLAVTEEALAGGHLLNARILRRLNKLTPAESTVGSKVTAKQFERILRQEQARGEEAA